MSATLAPGIPHATLEVLLVDPAVDAEGRDAHERVLAALRAAGLLGIVQRDTGLERLGMVRGAIATDAAGVAMRVGPGGPVPGVTLATVAARLQRALGAAVQCVAADPDGEPIGVDAWSVPRGFDPARSSQERTRARVRQASRVVSLVPCGAELVRQRLPEIAQSADGAVTLVPIGDRSIVVVEGSSLVPWAEELRPVLSLAERDERVELLVWLRRPPAGEPSAGVRWGGEPSWALTWDAPPTPIAGEHEHPAALAMQDRLRMRQPMEVPDQLLDELELQPRHRTALERLWEEDVPGVTAARVALALGLPIALGELAADVRAASSWPGAEVREPETIERPVAAARRAKPTRTGAWARMERWWSDHPRSSIAAGIGMLAFAAAVCALVVVAPETVGADRGPLYLWLAMGLVAVNGVGAIVMGVLGLRDPSAREERTGD